LQDLNGTPNIITTAKTKTEALCIYAADSFEENQNSVFFQKNNGCEKKKKALGLCTWTMPKRH
jgi:hypothetical protein